MAICDKYRMCCEMPIERKSAKTLRAIRKGKIEVKSGFANARAKRDVGLLVCDASMRGTLVYWVHNEIIRKRTK